MLRTWPVSCSVCEQAFVEVGLWYVCEWLVEMLLCMCVCVCSLYVYVFVCLYDSSGGSSSTTHPKPRVNLASACSGTPIHLCIRQVSSLEN